MAKTRARTAFRPKLISIAVASCFATSTALANPTGGVTTHGIAAKMTNPAANVLNIQTFSPQTIINWGSFSISVGELTRFMQPSAASAVLNRIAAGASPSSILGTLESNGRVFLINPNGITFGAGSQINVAGLVASTLNLTDTDFLAGRMRFSDGLGKTLENQGNITTPAGGSVYLVGSAVTNGGKGIITSPQGEVILAAGNSVELVNPGTPNLRVEIAAADSEARNLGQIISDAGRIGIYAGLINNSGTIRADSAVSDGGRILLKATKSTTLESNSVLSAQGKGGGEIKVLADESVKVAGRLDASAPNGGDGGFIETSAKEFAIDPSAVITTSAAKGKTGTWLIDPLDFTIAPIGTPGDITGAALSGFLNNTSILVTSDGIVGPPNGFPGSTVGNGDIFVNDTVSWSSVNSLTLAARGNVNVNQAITNGGTGAIAMYAGWDANTTNPNVICCSGAINLMAPISTAGTAVLVAGSSISQNLSGSITAARLLAKSGFGGVALDGAVNNVGTLAGDTPGFFHFKNGPSLIVGSVDSGNTAIGVVSGVKSSSANEVAIAVTAGDLTVNSNIIAAGGNSNNASIVLAAKNNITSNGATISAVGNPGEGDGDASVTLVAQNGAITLDSSTVESLSGTGCCGTSRNASLSMNAGSDIVLNSSTVTVAGGANSNGNPGGSASATLTASGSIQVMSQSTIDVTGGDGGANFTNGGNGGNASLVLNGGSITVSSSSLSATGGSGGSGGTGGQIQLPGRGGNGGNAIVSLNGGAISVTGASSITAAGGSGGSGAFGIVAGAGGNGGTATVTLTGSAIAIDGSSTVSAFGGSGGVGGSGNASGGNGGIGGNATVALTGSSVSVTGSTIIVSGGGGGTGGSGSGSSGIGGVGGVGGSAMISVSGSSISVVSSTLVVNGGDGGDGGFVFEGGTGGNGGAGGNASASLAGGSVVLSGPFISVNGGSGGDGGSASSGGRGGNGGAGGGASVMLTGSSIAITGNIIAFGGNGGNGGRGGSGSSEGFGGNGGNGGEASVMLSAGSITLNGGFISAVGGSAGFAGFGNSGSGTQGAGGSASVLVAANAGNVFTQFSGIFADGAEGGSSVINLISPGNITVTSTSIQAGDSCCINGTNGGASAIGLAAGGNITVDGGEGLFANGGSGNVNGGTAAITLAANGGISILNQASVQAFGGTGSTGTGGDAAITFAANGGSIMLQNTMFTIEAVGGAGPITGGSAAVTMAAAGGITLDAARVMALGGPTFRSQTQNGGLGVVSLDAGLGTINLLNGSIVEAAGGLGTVSDGTARINMTFTGRSTGGYFIDGVEGLIVDDSLLPTTGFFVNAAPAILDQNLIVTYFSNVIFNDILVATMNQQADVLADQLKAGDTGEPDEKEKKKLALCS